MRDSIDSVIVTDDLVSSMALLKDAQVEHFISEINRIYAALSQTTDLRPSQAINDLFGELVNLCTQTLSKKATRIILQDPLIQEITPPLRQLCATAECKLESHWAEYILGATSDDETGVFQRLKEFPYYENYVDLTRMELSAIKAVRLVLPQRIAFIGSGPLPWSSFCLCQSLKNAYPGTSTVLNVDKNPQAIFQSSVLAKKLGERAQGMEFCCQEAGSSALDLRDFDVVYLAALVGITQEDKEHVLIEITRGMAAGSLLVVRTAHGLRSLLYPEFDATTKAVLACLDICLVVHPYNHVVNSVIVGRVRARARHGERL